MAEVYFHCSDASHELIDGTGTTVNDLSEAFAHADGLMRAMLMNPKHGRLARLPTSSAARSSPSPSLPSSASCTERTHLALPTRLCADAARSGISIAVRRAV